MNAERAHKLVTVLCACIRRKGGQEVLLSMRHAPGVSGLDGKWELPGGKIEFGETPEQALIREIREEIGLEVRLLRLLPYLHKNVWEYEHTVQQVVLACYECEPQAGSEAKVSDDVRWFETDAIDFDATLPGTRDFVSLALGHDLFDKCYIGFELVDPDVNANKHFALAVQPTLFSRYGLVRYWGRKGRWSRAAREIFDSAQEMDSRIFALVKLRLSHGYRITDVVGRVQRYHVLGEIIELARGKHAFARDISAPGGAT